MKSFFTLILSITIILFTANSCFLVVAGAVSGAQAISKKRKENKFNIDEVTELRINLDGIEGQELNYLSEVYFSLSMIIPDEKKGEQVFLVGKDMDINLSDFDIQIKGGRLEGDKLIIETTLDEFNSGNLTINVVNKAKPSITAKKEFNLLETPPALIIKSAKGKDGSSGYDGKGAYTSNAGNPCRDGEDGQYGKDGANGAKAKDVEVFIKKIENTKSGQPILIVLFKYADKSKIAYLDPSKQNTLKINTSGGNGGDGGKGGMGGYGTNDASSCRGGKGGDGGNGGDGGDGGNVIINIDPNVDLSSLTFDVVFTGGKGGEGGSGGTGGTVSGQSQSTKYASGKNGRAGRNGSNGGVTKNTIAVSDNIFQL